LTEHDTIQGLHSPATIATLQEDLQRLGMIAGDTVLVHSSLSEIGWVCGGAVAVIEALLGVLGSRGTLVMPTHTAGNTDPKNWQNPPIPKEWWPLVRANLPGFDRDKTPSKAMGIIAETFRKWPGTLRSRHPIGSFAARGAQAEVITDNHQLEDMFGEGSPLGCLYGLKAKVLLIGVGHDSNTPLHLAEHRADFTKQFIDEGTAIVHDGQRKWVHFNMPALETDDFCELGASFASRGGVVESKVGQASSKLMSICELVDFGVSWMNKHRID